ncbi:MAG: redox-regulated ATPase YchF [Candidatus Sumerlaeia bacterium]|nr:redox-regulated ATPase YchF [Candidatus Sumerlaeia bacterium]
MPLQAGIVGLPNVGKSTLFNAITAAKAEAANYPFCTIDPNVGVVEVPDERLKILTQLVKPQKTIPTAFEFVDIAGLVRGASKGEGLGNQFLSHIREVDAIIEVVRCFEDEDITHVAGKIDPLDDIQTINLELVFADMASMERRIERTAKAARGDKKLEPEMELCKRVLATLEEGKFALKAARDEDEDRLIRSYQLLTAKPIVYVCNVLESEVADSENNELVKKVRAFAEGEGAQTLVVSAKVESEIALLEEEEKEMFLEELGLKESGLDRLIHAAYHLLGLGTYLTAGEKEVRAWTFQRGWKAPRCAGVIHTDFERLFIRAEVVAYEDVVEAGGMAQAKEAGKLRVEGKEYVMQDGDVCNFRVGQG